jgi:phosphoglycerate kinase
MMAAALRDGVVDTVLTCGMVANVMLVASGVDIGVPSADFIRASQLEKFIEESKTILAQHGRQIVLPTDLAYVKDGERVEVEVVDLPVDEALVDIGHKTVEKYAQVIAAAGTVFVNGPAGIFEKPETEYGTKSIWEAMAASSAFSALGGGDSVTAMNRYGLADRFGYVCTAGGAMVQFLSGKPMPVIEALKASAARFG